MAPRWGLKFLDESRTYGRPSNLWVMTSLGVEGEMLWHFGVHGMEPLVTAEPTFSSLRFPLLRRFAKWFTRPVDFQELAVSSGGGEIPQFSGARASLFAC